MYVDNRDGRFGQQRLWFISTLVTMLVGGFGGNAVHISFNNGKGSLYSSYLVANLGIEDL